MDITMAACQNTKCVGIQITDDSLLEGDERFFVSLSNLRSLQEDERIRKVRLNPVRAQITINDNDG